jgi:hypothetical protein
VRAGVSILALKTGVLEEEVQAVFWRMEQRQDFLGNEDEVGWDSTCGTERLVHQQVEKQRDAAPHYEMCSPKCEADHIHPQKDEDLASPWACILSHVQCLAKKAWQTE